jgi:hypothetical protein
MKLIKRKREREVRKYSRRVGESESHEMSERHFIVAGRKSIIL